MSIQIVIGSNSADFRQIIKAALEPIPYFEVCVEVTALDIPSHDRKRSADMAAIL